MGEKLDLTVEDISSEGHGVGRHQGLVVFVPFALRGERVRARIYDRRSSFARADLTDVLEPSLQRIDPPCPAFGRCGGCSWQMMSYSRQLEEKRLLLIRCLQRLARLTSAEDVVSETLPSPALWGYRNRIRLHGDGRCLGFFAARSRQVVALETCPVASPTLGRVLAGLEHPAVGQLPEVEIRSGDREDALVGLPGPHPVPEELEQLLTDLPGVRGVALPGGETLGRCHLHHSLSGLRFRVSWPSFFQVNDGAAEIAYSQIRYLVDSAPGDGLLDLYAGVGAAGLIASHDSPTPLLGIESARSAVRDARHNAAMSGKAEARFMPSQVERALENLKPGFSAAVLNPPRAGCSGEALCDLVRLKVPRLIYMSCNPATLARDVARLAPYYQLERVVPIDMFPHTHHLESVSLLSRTG